MARPRKASIAWAALAALLVPGCIGPPHDVHVSNELDHGIDVLVQVEGQDNGFRVNWTIPVPAQGVADWHAHLGDGMYLVKASSEGAYGSQSMDLGSDSYDIAIFVTTHGIEVTHAVS